MAQPTEHRRSVLARYFAQVGGTTPLSRDRERELTRHIRRGCTASRNELVQSNLGFVAKVAIEYSNLGLPLEDLLNEGTLGLIQASERFDPSKGNRFLTYAVWWIRKSILRALSDQSNLVRVPGNHLLRARELSHAETRLRRELGRRPTRTEISKRLSRTESQVDDLRLIMQRPTSIDDSTEKRPIPWSDLLVDERASRVVHELIDQEAETVVHEAVEQLDEIERLVIRHRFGLDDGNALTLREVGEILGVSRERVRQIQDRAKERLRKLFRRRYGLRR